MIFRILALTVALTMGTTAAIAETVEVRSGEHADFSRLVIQFDGQPDWVFGRSDNGYTLQVKRQDVDFDASGVFSRIPKSRITDVTNGADGGLDIRVADNVHADVFELRAGRVVIDIKDGLPEEASPFEALLESAQARESVLETKTEDAETEIASAEVIDPQVSDMADPQPSEPIADLSGAGGEVLGRAMPSINLGDIGTFGRAAPEQAVEAEKPMEGAQQMAPPDSPESPLAQEDTQAYLAELEKMLFESIGRAAADGLLSPSTPLVDDAVDAAEVAVEATEPQRFEPEPEQPGANSHLSIQSSIERAQSEAIRARSGFAIDGDACIPSARIDVAYWGLPIEDGLDLPRMRAGLVDELDAPVNDAMLNLAKYYIFLTFGAEANSILDDVPRETQGFNVYRALADIMETGQTNRESPLENQLSCNTHAALWGVLARPSLGAGDDVNVTAVLQTFNGFPPHLRLFLGPALADRLIENGELDAAVQVESIIGRASVLPQAEKAQLDAKVAAAKDDAETQSQLLEKLSLEHAMTHPQALIDFIDLARRQGTDVSTDIVEISEVVAVEYLGHELQPKLIEAAFHAKLQGDDAAGALEYLDEAVSRERLPAQDARALEVQAISAIIETGSDGLFLRKIFMLAEKNGLAAQSEEDRQRARDRFAELGFSDQADLVRLSSDEDPDEVADTVSDSEDVTSALNDLISTTKGNMDQSGATPTLAELDTLLSGISQNREMLLDLLDE